MLSLKWFGRLFLPGDTNSTRSGELYNPKQRVFSENSLAVHPGMQPHHGRKTKEGELPESVAPLLFEPRA
jgi:hypothetical protein